MKNCILLALFFNYISNTTSLIINLNEDDKTRLKLYARFAYSTMPTIYNTYILAASCIEQNIEGDFVECGVAAGAQIGCMAYACQKYNNHKKIHLFDSFEGIPLAGPNDTEQPGIGAITHNTQLENLDDLLKTTGVSAWSIESVRDNISSWNLDKENIIYHKGWFQYTLPIKASKIDKISFLRLDGDLYESTKVCLEYLYPKIVKNGYIVIDDYALTGCRKAVDEYLTKNNLSPKINIIEGGLGPVYWQID